MGGRGSGRPKDYWRDTVEGTKRLDVRYLTRHKLLAPSHYFSLSWTRNGKPTGNIGALVNADATRITLLYKYRRNEGPWEEVKQTIPVVYTPCNYGGKRPWFLCACSKNGVPCGRRVAVLYGADKLFACRYCYELRYQNQYEDLAGRLLNKAQNIRERLGGSSSLFDFFPDKPKRMHWKTYFRLREEGQAAERLQWYLVAKRFGLLTPEEKRRRR